MRLPANYNKSNMATNRYTIILEETDGNRFKLCRVLLTSDGSYFVTCPYHQSEKVFLSKMRINYKNPSKRAKDPPLEYSILEDDEHRLKLSHHPDGFIQFSGQGIVSGRNSDGTPKGLGIMSWPLLQPTAGPACAISIQTPSAFKKADLPDEGDVVFHAAELYRTDRDNGLAVELYYFPAGWRRFVSRSARGPVIWLQHPAGSVLELRVCMSPPDNWEIGFLGVDVWPRPMDFGANSGFAISSSTGNLGHNSDGELEGTAIFAAYPAMKDDFPSFRMNLALGKRDVLPLTKC